jgi:hypothetical protein
LLTAVFSFTAWAVSLIQQQANKPQSPKAGARSKTLREAAQERDVELTSLSESETEFADPVQAARDAHAVVLGRIVKAESVFTGSDFIDTYFTVEVQRVLQDNTAHVPLPAGAERPALLTSPLKFVRAGGAVRVNGHTATVKVKGRELLAEGKTYILLLEWSPAYQAYHLMGGISGVILVEPDLLVRPLASSEETKRKYEGTHLEAFITKLARAKQ